MSRENLILASVLVGLLAANVLYGADAPMLTMLFSGSFFALAAATPSTKDVPKGAATAAMIALLVITIGQVGAGEFQAAIPDLLALTSAMGVFLIGRRLCLSTDAATRTFDWAIVALLVYSVLAFLDHVAAPDYVFGRFKAYHHGRLTATFLSANTAATFFSAASIFAAGVFLRHVERSPEGRLADQLAGKGLLPGLLILFALVCLFLTGSRAGIAVGVTGLAALFLWSLRAPSVKYMVAIGAGVVIVGGLIFSVSNSVMFDRMGAEGVGTTGRDVLWPACWESFRVSPLFGHGLGQFTSGLQLVITQETSPILTTQGAAHNLVLQWLVQGGVIGLFGAGVLIIVPFFILIRGLNNRHRLRTPLKAIIVLSAAVILHGMVDYALEIPALMWWFALYLGIGAGIAEGETTTP